MDICIERAIKNTRIEFGRLSGKEEDLERAVGERNVEDFGEDEKDVCAESKFGTENFWEPLI